MPENKVLWSVTLSLTTYGLLESCAWLSLAMHSVEGTSGRIKQTQAIPCSHLSAAKNKKKVQ